jgi:hypothetical protein
MMAPTVAPRIDPAIAAITAARADPPEQPPAKPRAKPKTAPSEGDGRLEHLCGIGRRASRHELIRCEATTRPGVRRGESSVERLANQPGGESRDQPGGEGQGPNAQHRKQRPAGGQPLGQRRARRQIGFNA